MQSITKRPFLGIALFGGAIVRWLRGAWRKRKPSATQTPNEGPYRTNAGPPLPSVERTHVAPREVVSPRQFAAATANMGGRFTLFGALGILAGLGFGVLVYAGQDSSLAILAGIVVLLSTAAVLLGIACLVMSAFAAIFGRRGGDAAE